MLEKVDNWFKSINPKIRLSFLSFMCGIGFSTTVIGIASGNRTSMIFGVVGFCFMIPGVIIAYTQLK